jgi:hypothetical protein
MLIGIEHSTVPSLGCGTRRKRVQNKRLGLRAIATYVALLLAPCVQATAATSLVGHVLNAGQSVGGAAVTFYAAGSSAPTQLAQGRADDSGAFTLTYGDAPAESVLYAVAEGGTPKAAAGKGANDGLTLLVALGTSFPKTITVNELTTVASAFTARGSSMGNLISGNPLGLRMAVGNTLNLVDPLTRRRVTEATTRFRPASTARFTA